MALEQQIPVHPIRFSTSKKIIKHPYDISEKVVKYPYKVQSALEAATWLSAICNHFPN